MFKSITAVDVIKLLNIPRNLFREQCKSIRYKDFTSVYEFGDIRIFGNAMISAKNPLGSGAYLALSGNGCKQLISYLDAQNRSIGSFIKDCMKSDPQLHCTRIDIAIDDLNPIPYFTIELLHEKCNAGEFRSKSRAIQFIESKNDTADTAKTLYIGRRKSSVFYRFYDKDKETALKNHMPFDKIQSRKRTEIQLRDKKATALMGLLAKQQESIGSIAFGVLSSSLAFIERDDAHINKSRWSVSPFWSSFIGDVRKISLSVEETDNTLTDTQYWLMKGGSLSAIKAFRILERNNALDNLKSIDDLQVSAIFSDKLTKKIEEHLCRIHKEDVIPEIRKYMQ